MAPRLPVISGPTSVVGGKSATYTYLPSTFSTLIDVPGCTGQVTAFAAGSITCTFADSQAPYVGTVAVTQIDTLSLLGFGFATTTTTFDVNVVPDLNPPVLSVPPGPVVPSTSNAGAIVTYQVTAVDAVSGPATPSCSPASGTRFPIGSTSVTCTADDWKGNHASGGFSVKVTDATPPTLSLPAPITTNATSSGGAIVTFSATASDFAPASPAVTCLPASGTRFAIGTTTVTCRASDAAGNQATGQFGVTVLGAAAEIQALQAYIQGLPIDATTKNTLLGALRIAAASSGGEPPKRVCGARNRGDARQCGREGQADEVDGGPGVAHRLGHRTDQGRGRLLIPGGRSKRSQCAGARSRELRRSVESCSDTNSTNNRLPWAQLANTPADGQRPPPVILRRMASWRVTIGVKIFAIAAGLLAFVAVVALVTLTLARDVGQQLDHVIDSYIPAYGALSAANVRSVEQGLYLRRIVIGYLETPQDPAGIQSNRQRLAEKGQATDVALGDARSAIGARLANPGRFTDVIGLARLDTNLELMAAERRRYDRQVTIALAALEHADAVGFRREMAVVDGLRDEFNQRIDGARREMLRLASAAAAATRRRQDEVIRTSLVLMAIVGATGLLGTARITLTLGTPGAPAARRYPGGGSRSARHRGARHLQRRDWRADGRLQPDGHAAADEGAHPRDVRQYVDPRIVEGLIDRPALDRRRRRAADHDDFFSDIKGFTSISEGLTPTGLVHVTNHYLTTMSAPVREHHGIIDRYVGDAIMAFWGPPFSTAEEQARLACLRARPARPAPAVSRAAAGADGDLGEACPTSTCGLGLPRARSSSGTSVRRDQELTVMGDTVNFASRLEGGEQDLRDAAAGGRSDHGAGGSTRLRRARSTRSSSPARPRRTGSSRCSGERARLTPPGSRCASALPQGSPRTGSRPGRRRPPRSRRASRSFPATARPPSFSSASLSSASIRLKPAGPGSGHWRRNDRGGERENIPRPFMVLTVDTKKAASKG